MRRIIMRDLTIFIAGVALAIGASEIAHRLEPKQQVIVWNDDEESMPNMGSTVILEFIENDTIYIGPNENFCEYQFECTDDSITVRDFGRPVGTVKLEGQLKRLIDKDNE